MAHSFYIWHARHGSPRRASAAAQLQAHLAQTSLAAPDDELIAFLRQHGADEAQLNALCTQPTAAWALMQPSGDAALGRLLQAAAQHHLVVFNAERQWLWLPDGTAYPKVATLASDRAQAAANDQAPLAQSAIVGTALVSSYHGRRNAAAGWEDWVARARAEFGDVLRSTGFDDVTPERVYEHDLYFHAMFERTTAGGVMQKVQFQVGRYESPAHAWAKRWSCRVQVSLHAQPIEHLYATHADYRKRLDQRTEVCELKLGHLDPNLPARNRHAMPMATAAERQAYLLMLRERLLPTLDALSSLRELLLFASTPAEHVRATWTRVLLLAWLCGHSDHARLVNAARDEVRADNPRNATGLEMGLLRLDEELALMRTLPPLPAT